MTIRKKHERVIEKKKESRDSALMRGTEDLLTLGVDLETLGPTAESVARLAGLQSSSLEATRAIACWLGFAEIPEAAEALAALEEAARDKEVKREIRRSIFRLEQKGVTVPRRAPDSGASILLTREADHAYLSPVDSRGDNHAGRNVRLQIRRKVRRARSGQRDGLGTEQCCRALGVAHSRCRLGIKVKLHVGAQRRHVG